VSGQILNGKVRSYAYVYTVFFPR